MIQKTETRYHCQRDTNDPDSYDDFMIRLSNEKTINAERLPVRVVVNVPDRWRNLDDMIDFYEWIVTELKNFKKQRSHEKTTG